MDKWIENEIRHLDLGDIRRTQRVGSILRMLTSQPGATIPEASSNRYEMKATYDFFKNKDVSPELIYQAHCEASIIRSTGSDFVLVAHDTTNLGFPSSPAEGLGYLDNKQGRGFMVHSGMLISPGGTSLGIIHRHVWTRDLSELGKRKTRFQRPYPEKESFKWELGTLSCYDCVPEDKKVLHITDREGDIIDFLCHKRPNNHHLLVRARHNRNLGSGQKLRAMLSNVEPAKTIKLAIARRKNALPKTIDLEIRFSKIDLPIPPGKTNLSPTDYWVVMASEVDPPANEKGIEWILHTTMPVNTADEAMEMVRYYSLRWLIERYHFVLKSGCGIEALQLQTAPRLENALAVYSIVAWRLLWMTYLAREEPELGADLVLEEHEWKGLYWRQYKTFNIPQKPPSLAEAIRWIAMLGGYLGRNQDGPPGVKNLWRGMKKLNEIAYDWKLIQEQLLNI